MCSAAQVLLLYGEKKGSGHGRGGPNMPLVVSILVGRTPALDNITEHLEPLFHPNK